MKKFTSQKIKAVRIICRRATRMRLMAEEIEDYCDLLLDLEHEEIDLAKKAAERKPGMNIAEFAADLSAKLKARKPRKAA